MTLSIDSLSIDDPPGVQEIRANLLSGLVPLKDFAKAVRRDQRTVYHWIARGCPCVRLGAERFFDLEAVKQWMLESSKPAGASAPPAPRGRGRPRKQQSAA